MPESPTPSVNSWLEDELYHQYLYDRKTVDPNWTQMFEANGHVLDGHETLATNGAPVIQKNHDTPMVPVSPGDQLIPLRGPALRIAENMTASLTIPIATSQRVMPVKVIDENRRAINQHRSLNGQSKISYTHLVAWAIVKAARKIPGTKSGVFGERSGIFPRHATAT